MNSISRFLPSISQGSFLANQWLRIQNSPLAVRITLVVAGIFAGAALAYACFKGIQSLWNRIAPPTPQQNPINSHYIQNGIPIHLTLAQIRTANAITNAVWFQIQCPRATWEQIPPEQLNTATFAINVVPSFPSDMAPNNLLCHQQVLPRGGHTRMLEISREQLERGIANGEWKSKDEWQAFVNTIDELRPQAAQ